MSRLRIAGGTVYDPANGLDGVVADLWIENGRITSPPADPDSFRGLTIDARGDVIMPGGVDMHCHLAGPKVNAGRLLTPERFRSGPKLDRTALTRSGLVGSVPTTFATGYLFSRMGYTTAIDAAIPPLHARHAHDELADTPLLDKGFLVLFGNNHYVLDRIAEGDHARLDAYLGWALGATRGCGVKVVNPGGVEDYKQISRKLLHELDEPVDHFGVTPRQIVSQVAASVDRLGLPHAVHLHCNNLGVPGNWETTRRTMETADGHRAHFAHIQFHSYTGDPNDPTSFGSATPQLVDYLKAHPGLTVDVGHVNPGPTLVITGDTPASVRIRNRSHAKWFSADGENESSCGVIPIEYLPQKNLISAIQWAIALEWYLLMDDPWRVALTSDHPNGGAFYRYPEIIALLMDRDLRREALAQMPEAVRERTTLADLDREYTLGEIAIITRAAPSRILGLPQKGHLAPGADADITVYRPQADRRAMFERPRWVIRMGEVVVDNGEIRAHPAGRTFFAAPDYDQGVLPSIRAWFERDYSIRFANYAIDPEEIPHALALDCSPARS